MTLIIGLNLSDKIYLAGDTRVTQPTTEHPSGKIFIDNVIKIGVVYDQSAYGTTRCPTHNRLNVAVAGDVALATHSFSSIQKDIFGGLLSSDIRLLHGQIDQTYITKLADTWLSKGGPFDVSCCLIFGGTAPDRPKMISPEKLQELVKKYKEETFINEEKRQKIEEIAKSDFTWQAFAKKLQADSGKTPIQLLEESSVPKVSPEIQSALDSGLAEISDFADSLIFSVEIVINQSGATLKKKKAEWGQFLARGSRGIEEGDLPDSLLAVNELRPSKTKTQEHLIESAMIDTSIRDLARERGIDTIGGAVVLSCLKKNSNEIIAHGQTSTNGQIHLEIHGKIIPVFPFFMYHKMPYITPRAEL